MQKLLISKGNKPRKGEVIKCICGNEFYVRKSVVKKRNFCSKDCMRLIPTTKLKLTCRECGKEYLTYRSQVKHRGSSFCSLKCGGDYKSKAQFREKNHAWKGGISPEHHRIRESKQFKNWRKAVFERDNYTCQFCGIKGSYLEPDHIKPFAYFKELRFDITNGRTLCKPCHKTTDTYGDKAKKLYGMG